jgi:hypothetical protein
VCLCNSFTTKCCVPVLYNELLVHVVCVCGMFGSNFGW